MPVLDDELDEGSETLTMTVWNWSPQYMSVADPTGTGTIFNTDRMPTAWIARFGRTVGEQVLDAVDARMRANPAPGAEIRLAGQRIGLGPLFGAGTGGDAVSGEARALEPEFGRPRSNSDPALQDVGPRPGSPGFEQAEAGRVLLPGTSFSMTTETAGPGFVSIWGRGAVTRFSGREGDLALDGEVATGLLGADWTRGRWTTGLLVTHSLGDGSYRGTGADTVTAALTGVWPWVRLAPGERLSVWGVAGFGEGRARTGARLSAEPVVVFGFAVSSGDSGYRSHRLSLPVGAPYGSPTRFKPACIVGAHSRVGRNPKPRKSEPLGRQAHPCHAYPR